MSPNYAPGLAEFVERANQVLPPNFHTRPVPEQRALYAGLVDAFPVERPAGVTTAHDAVTVDGHTVGLRVYRTTDEPGQPAVLYFHGGGFVLGGLDTHDAVVAELAAKAGVTAIAVDFRPAPEHPFPAAVEDGWTALRGVVADADRFGIDPDRVGVAGDSSGANLAVVTCLVTRDRGGPRIAAQSLVSPVLDFARWRSGGEDAPLLSGDEMVFFTACYVGRPANVEHRYVSPLLHETFEGLPPAYVMAAELDSLKVDALTYADRLRANGIPVELVVEPGFVHACVRARSCSAAVQDAVDRWCAATARLLAPRAATAGAVR